MCSGVSRGLHLPLLLELVLLCAKGTKQERSVNMQTISRQSNNVLRTVISILLAFVLMVGQMPALAYADTTNEQAVTQQEDTAATSSSETDSSDSSSPDDTSDSSEENGDLSSESSDNSNQEPEGSNGSQDTVNSTSGATEQSSKKDTYLNDSDENKQLTENVDQNGESENTSEGLASLLSASTRDAESDRIYSSVDALESGTYTVTANVSMMTPIPGVRGYATNPANPEGIGGTGGIPNMPRTNNATLTITENGECILIVDLVNPVFTVQQVGNGTGISVLECKTTPIETKDSEDYNQGLANAGITTRISQLTLKLDNFNGTYSLQNCKEYATTLGTNNPDNGWLTNNLDIDVDFAKATKIVEGDFEKTFSDPESGIKVTAKAEENSSFISQLQAASLEVVLNSDDKTSAITSALSQYYVTPPVFELYSIQLLVDGNRLEFDNSVALSVSIPKTESSTRVFAFHDAMLHDVSTSEEVESFTFESTNLGDYVVVDTPTQEWTWSYSSSDPETGISFGYTTDGKLDGVILGGDESMGAMYLGWYKDYFGYYYLDNAGDRTEQIVNLIKANSSFQNPQLDGAYSAGWSVEVMMGVPTGILNAPDYTFSNTSNFGWISVPATSSQNAIYYVSGTVGTGITSIKEVQFSFSDGHALVELSKENLGTDNPIAAIYNAASGVEGATGMPQSDTTSIGYIVVASEALTSIEKPIVQTGLKYNGQEQTGVSSGEGYDVIEGGSGTAAGEYTCLVKPKEGYVWTDGGNEIVPLSWSIAPAELTATYAGEEISQGTEPNLAVEVSGFVNGETAETAAGFESPSVSLPEGVTIDTLQAGQSYELTPAGGKADSYTFTYVGGTLKVAQPEKTLEPGTYTITANLWMPGEYNPIIKGLNVYANNPNNPFGPVIDENTSDAVENTVPSTPLSMNAQLIVGEDGTKTLVLPIKNPVFTTQDLGTCENLNNVKVERVAPADASAWDYGKYDTRIHMMSAELTDTLVDEGTATYIFKGSKLYAVPLDMDLAPEGDVALQLDVDYGSAKWQSDSTEVPVFKDDSGTGGEDPDNPGTNPGGNTGGETGGNTGGNIGGNTGGNQGGSQGGNHGSVTTTEDGHIAAGTYTVSANIWFDKATTGLPLNPHLTNGGFPPKDPVSNNATLRVDNSGHATVTIPITIQDRVMQVRSISGLNIVDYATSGGKITSITVDLGVLSSSDTVIRKSCQVSVHIGDLAMTIASGIFNGVRDHTWNATFQLNFSGTGLPSSGGGTIPAEALALMSGTDAVSDTATAQAEALDALADPNSSATANGATGNPLKAVADSVAHNPLPWVIGGVVVVAALAGAIYWILRRRKI